MKYWRGYLVAAILLAFTLGFREIAEANSQLVDMIYPYVTRLVQNYMATWSGSVSFCVWQAVLLALVIGALASIVLMAIFHWNPIQWFGWVVAVASLILLLHTGIYGMNEFAGPIAEDIRLTEAECTDEQMEAAAVYYRDKANELAAQVTRGADGAVQVPALSQLNEQAVNGFQNLVYEQYYSVFAGTTAPVKELGLAEYFTARGQMGYTVPITGEAAVNMEAPSVMLPFAVCREMCYRMTIASERDKHFAAFMTCQANEDPVFQYAGYVMAYRYCLGQLPKAAAATVAAEADPMVKKDMDIWSAFVGKTVETDPDVDIHDLEVKLGLEEEKKVEEDTDKEIAKLLLRWHHQTVTVPSQAEPEAKFDPYDEKQVDMTGLPHVK